MIQQFAAFFLAFKGIENIQKTDGPLTADSLFTNSIFRNIVISLVATLGLYVAASIIFVRFRLSPVCPTADVGHACSSSHGT